MVARLRRSYSVALAFAGDLPWLGRCVVKIDRSGAKPRDRRRWVARLPARVYVETHVRSQLDHLISCLRDEMLDPDREDRLATIVSSLEPAAARLTSWKRVKALVLRVPPVAAALPVLTAFTNPLSDIESGDVVDAGVVTLVSAGLGYLLIVWPSLNLGFRVKRAIFAGGVDLARPWAAVPGTATWRGFQVRRKPATGDIVDDFRGWRARRRARRADAAGAARPVDERFPRRLKDLDVYLDEDVLFGHLARRKLEEAPIDLVLSVGPYLTTLFSVLTVASYVAFIAGGGLADDPEYLFFVPLFALLPLLPVQLIWQLRANLWKRRHPEQTSITTAR